MLNHFAAKVALGVGALTVAASISLPMASAGPDLSFARTTCTYDQFVAALNAEQPSEAADFNNSPVEQSFLREFLAQSMEKRERYLRHMYQVMPRADYYINTFGLVADSCHNY